MKKKQGKRKMFTVGETASRWGVSPTYIYREIWAGRLKVVRFGRALRISEDDIEKFESDNYR